MFKNCRHILFARKSNSLAFVVCKCIRLFLANAEIPLSKRGIGILFFFIIIVRHLSALRRRKIEKKLAVDLTGANFSIGGGKNSVNFPPTVWHCLFIIRCEDFRSAT